MVILKVIHGYPMRYNAGSEVYSQTLCHALANRNEVHVFTREEDPFAPDFRLRREHDPDDYRVTLHVVNNPRLRDRYRAEGIDRCFGELLEELRPDIVHIGHLNHLSTSIVAEAARREIPVIYTLHDYWLMCPRGQFMQMFPEDPDNLWAACHGQEHRKCAERCYARYFAGGAEDREQDVQHWSGWVERRMRHVREVAELVDLFIAPSRYLMDRFVKEFGVPSQKVVHLDYGFARERMSGRRRTEGEPFTFGYIGTHIPAKGVNRLIEAFGRLRGDVRLRIWGRERGQETAALKTLAASLPRGVAERVEWLPEYKNQAIVPDVFNRIDALVVPSVWVENSPLVIHEAQQCRVPVITANAGGMAEFVEHDVNGLLFDHRDVSSLASQMQRLADDRDLALRLGVRGYLFTEDCSIPCIDEHSSKVEALYAEVLARRDSARLVMGRGPWRITFDTNPDTCNLKCIMCEEHSPHSPLQKRRKEERRPPRIMPFEMIERVVADAAPRGLREIIPSTMGEPLLYDRFEDIIALCERYGVKLNLTTNGTFPRLGAAMWAKKIVPFASDVKISWNGASRETHEAIMLGAKWDAVVENVRQFVAVREDHAQAGGNRCRVTFQLTFLESNIHELAAMVQLAAELGVDRVKGHHLWAHFDQIKDQSMRRSPESITRWNKAVSEARETAARYLLPTGKAVLLENIFPLEEAAMTDLAPGGQCPFLGQEAWVSAMGRFDPCCAPDAQRRTLGEFGDLHDSSLTAIWDGDRYRELIATYRNRPLCLSCNMRKPADSGSSQ